MLEVQDQGAAVVRFRWGLSPWLVKRHLFAVSSHSREGGQALRWVFYQDANPIKSTTPSCPHLNLISSKRPRVQTPSQWVLGLQHTNCGDGCAIQLTAMLKGCRVYAASCFLSISKKVELGLQAEQYAFFCKPRVQTVSSQHWHPL